jgi:hypothetical protein
LHKQLKSGESEKKQNRFTGIVLYDKISIIPFS